VPSGIGAGAPGIFSEDALQARVDAMLASIQVPPNCRGGLIGFYDIKGNWRVVAVQRIGSRWDIGATLQRDLGRISGSVVCRGFW